MLSKRSFHFAVSIFLDQDQTGNAVVCDSRSLSGLVRRRLRLVEISVRSMHGEGPRELGGRRGRALSPLTELAV
jgi:hypothetical protein